MASHEKGQELIRECKRQGCNVILLAASALEHGDWPLDSIDERFFMPSLYKLDDVIHGVSYLARTRSIDRIIPLDDFDVETAAALREHLRLPGIGATTARYFRDKLAMRTQTALNGVRVPDFVGVINYDRMREFMSRVPPPWVMKPRSQASAVGIKLIRSPEELWPIVDALGDQQSYYLLERYVPGEVFHIDSIVSGGQVTFAEVHKYGQPPMNVMHEGGVFRTRTVKRGSEEETALLDLNRRAIQAFGLQRGVTHLEAIRGAADGEFYFLECAARVGGANIADMVEASSGVNLWAEWAKIELLQDDDRYSLADQRYDYGGVIITLARQEYPDTSDYNDPEIVMRIDMRHHAGLVLASSDHDRLASLLDEYARRFQHDFTASLPPPESLTE
jgi:biotin carboxylase